MLIKVINTSTTSAKKIESNAKNEYFFLFSYLFYDFIVNYKFISLFFFSCLLSETPQPILLRSGKELKDPPPADPGKH